MNPQSDGITSAEMYDADIINLAPIWAQANLRFEKWLRRPSITKIEAGEIEKYLTEEAFKIGYTIRVHSTEAILGIGQLTMEVVDRIAGHEVHKYGFDHERKGWEVNRAVDTGTDERIRQTIRSIEPGRGGVKDTGKFL